MESVCNVFRGKTGEADTGKRDYRNTPAFLEEGFRASRHGKADTPAYRSASVDYAGEVAHIIVVVLLGDIAASVL
jgi:hypothetical protein